MKPLIATAILLVLSASGAMAQGTRPDPDNCIAEIGALDINGDGYVDNTEFTSFGQIETNVDTDGDGRISGPERTVACQRGVFRSLKRRAP